MTAILLVTVATNVLAANSATSWNPNQNGGQGGVAKSKPSPRPAPTVVEKVNNNTGLLAVKQGSVSTVYGVDAATKIVINGKPGKLSDLKPGMRVSVNTGSDATKAVKIDAGNGH